MKKALIALVLLAAAGGGGYWYYFYGTKKVEPTVNTAAISRGDIVDTVQTTGQLSAVSQVQVGAQVSGIIEELHVDFNDIVKKGQLLAKLDPSTIETQIQGAKANLTRSQTDVDRSKVSLQDAERKYQRSKDLFAKQLTTQQDLDTAEVNLHSAQASLKSSEASLLQSEASLKQNEVNLEHTIIYSPIDGIVISRVVDVGQTVNASMNAPALFTIAADLTKMKVIAGVDETDVGRIRPEQHVTFGVDAYQNETFHGTVEQVRLEPVKQQNVVTYQTVISVPNPELKLKPGMTANIRVEIARVNDVLRVPNTALRFRPSTDVYTALGIEPPADTGRGGRGRGGPGIPGTPGAPGGREGGARTNGEESTSNTPAIQGGRQSASAGTAQPGASTPGRGANPSGAPATAGGQQRSGPRNGGGSFQGGSGQGGSGQGGSGRSGGDRAAFEERMARMTPEEREQMMARRGGRGGGDGRGGSGRGGYAPNGQTSGRGGRQGQGGRGGGGSGRSGQLTADQLAASRGATTIDSLFPPLPPVESRGRVYVYHKDEKDPTKKELKSINLRLGVTDGQVTQVIDAGELKEGSEVVTNVITQAAVRPGFTGQQQGNPFFQGPGGGGRGPGGGGFGGPGGGGPGGGGGGGGNRGGGGRGGF
jgi:HlyD family secretion protein